FCSCLGFASFWSFSLAILGVHLLAVVLEHAHLAAVLQRLHADAVGLLGRRVGPLVLLHAVHPLDHQVVRVDAAHHRAALALVAPGEHHDFIALLDSLHQSTSGASDTIFMNLSVRSSRVTGPKMRVPIGSSLGVSSTAALRSKRMSEPSARR